MYSYLLLNISSKSITKKSGKNLNPFVKFEGSYFNRYMQDFYFKFLAPEQNSNQYRIIADSSIKNLI